MFYLNSIRLESIELFKYLNCGLFASLDIIIASNCDPSLTTNSTIRCIKHNNFLPINSHNVFINYCFKKAHNFWVFFLKI